MSGRTGWDELSLATRRDRQPRPDQHSLIHHGYNRQRLSIGAVEAAQLARQPDSWGAGGRLSQRSGRKESKHWPVPAQLTGSTKDNSVLRRLDAAYIAYEE
ncbi:MAG: hypothetical protein M3328_08235 [Chloroflexota bacterium]|nr:hypothetical protein [Chloroflexota bacterium]